jgi:hypothetical protein
MTDNYPLMKPFELDYTHGNVTIPHFQDQTSVYPTPTATSQGGLNMETIAVVVVVGVILGVIGGLLVYFRRLIFR